MRFPEYESYDALGLAQLIARGEVTASEVLEAAIARVEARNPRVNAVVARFDEQARERARAIAPGAAPFAGVPYLVKDLGVTITGLPTSNGSAVLKDLPAEFTSTIVRRLESAGLNIAGKTNTSEFGLTLTTEPRAFGPTRNPWNLDHSPGGSSGGAAAAVASGMVPAAHASDGGGSIRAPASCCGLFGMKPSRARVPMGPIFAEAWSGLSTAHAVTRGVRDSAALLDAVAGPESGDPYCAPPQARPYLRETGQSPGRLRIALQRDASPDYPSDPACRTAVENVAALCEDLGHIVEPAEPEVDRPAIMAAFLAMIQAHAADDLDFLGELLGRPLERGEMEAFTEALAERGRTLSAAAYARARTVLLGLGRVVGRFFESHDVLLTPTLAQPPVPLGVLDTSTSDLDALLAQHAAYGPFTAVANITGCPAMNVPLVWSDSGLPLGTMFMAALGREDLLFRLAAQLEEARPWWHKRPPIAEEAA